MIKGTIICSVVLLALHLLTPWWWWIIVVPFIYNTLVMTNLKTASTISVVSTTLVWGGYATLLYQTQSSIIAERVNAMIGLSSPVMLIVISVFVGICASYFSGLSGYFMRNAIKEYF